MPLIIDGGRVPSRWAERISVPLIAIDSHRPQLDGLSVALINNMPDPALEDTELQFFDLLDVASGDLPVYIKLYSLTGVPRTDRGERHLNSFYFPFDDLWQNRFDGVIITGTEPRYPNLHEEPYWNLLAEVFDWAQRNTSSTILSCLAAHASVLHCDGIKRHPLPDKRFGVFEATASDHALMSHAAGRVRFPHSRWNEVKENELLAGGYSILSKSVDAGVDVFVKEKKKCLFVHFQGHPEYGSQTLLKEYRRDIKRFLRHERETYPIMPHGYFDGTATEMLKNYRERAMADRREEAIDLFPESVTKSLQNTWQASANGVYKNWLQYMVQRRAERASFAVMARVAPSRAASTDGEII
jgi:homoserine O-succinyltransferase/O-acetyltransferase